MTDTSMDIIPCGYFSFSDDGYILRMNATASAALGFTEAELGGKTIEKIFSIPTKIFFQTHLFPLVKMHGHAEEIYVDLLTASGGELPVLLNAKRRIIEDRYITDCGFVIVNNRKKFEGELIAARKAAEKALRDNSELVKAKAELQQHSERLEEQMQVIARHYHDMQQINHAVTHNLKEPLRKVMMFAGKLDQSNTSPDLHRLLRSAEQMKGVVSALQQYVWLDEKQKDFRSHQLSDIIGSAIEKVKKENLGIVFDLQMEELPRITADEDQLYLLFYEIFSNAVKFRKGNQVDLQIRSTILKKNLFREMPGRYSYQDFVRLEIEDSGVGFDAKYSSAVFELFRKLHFGEGNGVGLSLAKKAVQNHGGFIEAESVPGAYTKFIVHLPLKQPGGP